MNRARRKEISRLINELLIIVDNLNTLCEAEEECLENLPDGIRESDRGCEMEEFVELLEDASSTIEDVVGNLQEII